MDARFEKRYGSSDSIRPELLQEIIRYAKQYDVKRLILFGSRARGDYKRTSDIDLAFCGGDASSFTLSVSEDTDTLLKFDIVNLDKAVQPELLESIQKEGVLLYEKI